MVKVYCRVANRNESYIYDGNGNRSQETITTVVPRVSDYTYYPGFDRLKYRISMDGTVKWAFTYDNNGNLIKKGNTFTEVGGEIVYTESGDGVIYWEYEYDVLGRLIAVWEKKVLKASYIYDPTGLRIFKNGTMDVFYDYDLAGNVIEEQTGSEIKSYVWVTGRHLARVDGVFSGGGDKYFYETDHLGSPMVVTNQSGQVVWRGDFTPFGERIKGDGDPEDYEDTHGFTGKDWDEDAGLYYFNARWYDPELGRFVEEDPIRDPNNPNIYAYCSNNPLTNTDPTGLMTEAGGTSGEYSYMTMRLTQHRSAGCHRTRSEQPAEDLVVPEAPVEPVTELIEIGLEMLLAQAMIGARDESLSIRDDYVDPFQEFRRSIIPNMCSTGMMLAESI